MSGPERINIIWRDNEPDDGFIEYTTIGRFIADVDGAESVDYVRADLVDPAAIRLAALREAHDAIADYPRVSPDSVEAAHYDEQIEHAQAIILALIDKGAG